MTARLAGASLYGLVNNAGTGLSHGRMTGESLTTPDMMEVNRKQPTAVQLTAVANAAHALTTALNRLRRQEGQ